MSLESLLGPPRMVAMRLSVFVGSMLFQMGYLDQGIFPPDEGIYCLYSLLLSRGVLPYVGFYDNHVPGFYFILGLLFKVLGPSFELARVAIYILNSLTALLIFEMVATVDSILALLSASLFVLGLPSFLATIVQLEPLIAALSVASMFLMIKGIDSAKRLPLIVSGVLSGYLVLVKLTAIVLPAFQFLYLLRGAVGSAGQWKIRSRSLFAFVVAAASASVGFLAFLAVNGSVGEFLDQAVLSNFYVTLRYLSEPPPSLTFETLQRVYLPILPLIIGLSLGILVANLRPLALASTLLLLLAFPRFHILHLLASFALALVLMGKGARSLLARKYSMPLSRRLRVGGILIMLIASAPFVWAATANAMPARIHVDPDLYLTVDFVIQNTRPDEAIFALPYRAEIYFLANRLFPLGGPGIVLPGVSQDDIIQRMRNVRLTVYNPVDTVKYVKDGATVVETMREYAPKIHSYIEANYLKVQSFGNFLIYMSKAQPLGSPLYSIAEGEHGARALRWPVKLTVHGMLIRPAIMHRFSFHPASKHRQWID